MSNSFSILITSVYPCVYREHGITQPVIIFFAGLSLCIQGTRDSFKHLFEQLWFIPVYTGNTMRDLGYSTNDTVYPCVYREHSYITLPQLMFVGLSLCIQGTRPLHTS